MPHASLLQAEQPQRLPSPGSFDVAAELLEAEYSDDFLLEGDEEVPIMAGGSAQGGAQGGVQGDALEMELGPQRLVRARSRRPLLGLLAGMPPHCVQQPQARRACLLPS